MRGEAAERTADETSEAAGSAVPLRLHRGPAPSPIDSVTGLPGRGELDRVLTSDVCRGRRVAAMFIDVDHFKRVNDTEGHHAGDLLLGTVARRIVTAASGGIVIRFGGDEFVVLLFDERARSVDTVAETICRDVSVPIPLANRFLVVSVSIGIAAHDGSDDINADQLLRDADIALYEAKHRGRGRVQVFNARLRRQVEEQVEIERALRDAVQANGVGVALQPIVDVVTGRVVGVESLARLRRDDGREVSPAKFIPAAEETGLIRELGRQLFIKACADFVDLCAAVPTVSMLSVNLSPMQLGDTGFVEFVLDTLAAHRIEAPSVCFELTESDITGQSIDPQMLKWLRQIGCYVGMDDFGTGMSSLARLRDLPVEVLKIDRSFVVGLGVDRESSAIVAAITSMALTMGLHVIAEGVENVEQARALAELGCPVAQGFLYARPMPVDDLIVHLTERDRSRELPDRIATDRPSGHVWSNGRVGRPTFIREFLEHIGVPIESEVG